MNKEIDAGILILGAGIAGLAASYRLREEGYSSLLLEKNEIKGGLCSSFSIDGFTFDHFVHLSFSEDMYVKELFSGCPQVIHKPAPYNYYHGLWLKHPVLNNLYPLCEEEKKKLFEDFKNRTTYKEVRDYETWLRMQYGDAFAETFPMAYTRKYWCVPADELETKWIGKRMYIPTLEEVENSLYDPDTETKYYAKEMRYPEQGGFSSFLKGWTENSKIAYKQNVIRIDPIHRCVYTEDTKYSYRKLLSSLPIDKMPEMMEMPNRVKEACQKLKHTSGYLVSLGFQGKIAAPSLWFYIYDETIAPARVYVSGRKSSANVPEGCSGLQAEVYVLKQLALEEERCLLENVISQLEKMGVFAKEQLIVKDIRYIEYANVIFDPSIYESRGIVRRFLKQQDILSFGRFGEWDYLWSDQSLLSGIKAAETILSEVEGDLL